MKKYTSCFIGIPLPSRFKNDFEDLLNQVRAISLDINTTDPKTPHITVCYLDKQSQLDLEGIEGTVKKSLGLVKGIKIKMGGLGYFGGDDPRVMFLNVECPIEVYEFNKVISKDLSFYSATENNLPFHPHMTVTNLNTPSAKQVFKDKYPTLVSLFNVDWEFELDEIGLYGVDSTKQPEFQEKLVSLKFL